MTTTPTNEASCLVFEPPSTKACPRATRGCEKARDANALHRLQGNLHLEGAITLNYDKIKVVVDLDLATYKGTGKAVPLSDEQYAAFSV